MDTPQETLFRGNTFESLFSQEVDKIEGMN